MTDKKKTIGQQISTFFREILIIVLGVSITIMMDQWNEDRVESKKGVELLKEISNNLKQDTSIFEENIQIINKKINHGIPLVTQENLKDLEDSLIILVSSLPNYVPFDETKIGYTYLEGSGGFNLIKNKTLLKKIIHVYSKEYKNLKLITENQAKYIQEEIIPFYNKKIPLIISRDLKELGKDLKPFMNSIKSSEYRNIIRIHVNMMGLSSRLYKKLLKEMKELIKEIDKEIKKLES